MPAGHKIYWSSDSAHHGRGFVLCAVPDTTPAAPPPSPSPPPPPPLPPGGQLHTEFHAIESGRCASPLRSIGECGAAAAALRAASQSETALPSYNASHLAWLVDTTPLDDGQTGGDSADPPFCYYRSGALRYNRGTNTGECSQAAKCLCEGEQSPFSPPPPRPPATPPGTCALRERARALCAVLSSHTCKCMWRAPRPARTCAEAPPMCYS